MNGFRPEQAINGTWGEMWFDGDYMAEVTAVKMEVDLKKTAVPRCRNLIDGQKVTGLEPKGEFKVQHVNSYVMKKYSDAVKAGKTPSSTIVTNIKDPDALGAERAAAYGCILDKLIIADWENGKLGERTYGFTYDDWELLDLI